MVLASLTLLLSLQAAPDSLDRSGVLGRTAVRERALSAAREQEDSPATFLVGATEGYTEVGVGFNGRRENRPAYVEEGRWKAEAVARVHTLVRLDSLQAVRGYVEYRNGRKGGVAWNSGSDFSTVYPYIVADTVGGKVFLEQYAFSGSYACRAGDFYFGVQGDYRALQEYRTVDPRPRSIVSDLRTAVAAGYAPGDRYAIDVTVAYRRYSQSQTIDFYSHLGNNSAVFHLTGLGGDFYRFAGASDAYLTTRYAGNGLQCLLSFVPVGGGRGWKASADYRLLNITHYLINQNNTPYTESLRREASLEAGWLDSRWAVWAHGRTKWLTGIESVIDNGNAGRFLELLRFKMYTGRRYDIGLDGVWEPGAWSFTAAAAWKRLEESYVYPVRKMNLSLLECALGGRYRRRLSVDWLCSAGFSAAYRLNLAGKLELPAAQTRPLALTHIRGRYEGLEENVVSAGVHLRADRRIAANLSLFLSIDGQFLSGDDGRRAGYGSLTLGCNF